MIDFTAYDALLNRAETNGQTLTEELRKFLFSREQLSVLSDFVQGLDPFSAAYENKIKTIHAEILGKEYCKGDEGLTSLDINTEAVFGFPYQQGSEVIGEFLETYGFIISAAQLPKGAAILEPGCGIGSLTEHLARSGYSVDALDINHEQCEIAEKKIKKYGASSRVICSDFSVFLQECEKKYDAVIFFESFHHFMNHKSIVEELAANHLAPDGKIILAGEPILEDTWDFSAILPYAWGPRFDGESLYQMRKRGWLELGFKESYIRELCEGLSLSVRKRELMGVPHSKLFVLTPATHTHTAGGIGGVSREMVVRAYHFFLGREPESEEAIECHMRCKSIHELTDGMIHSPEFIAKWPK